MLDDAYSVHDFTAGDTFEVGPFRVDTWELPHWIKNAGIRLSTAGQSLAFTGDTGPSPDLLALARGVDLYLAEATFPDHVPEDSAHYLSSAVQAAQVAAQASVRHLVLTHLWPGTDPRAAHQAAVGAYDGLITVARPGLIIDLTS